MSVLPTTLSVALSLLSNSVAHQNVFRPQVVVGEEDRLPASDQAIGRLGLSRRSYEFCTATLISRSCAVTAGHCKRVAQVLEFDLEHKPNTFTWALPENRFEVDVKSINSEDNGKGSDWAVFRLKANRKTGEFPGDTRAIYPLSEASPQDGSSIIVAGYGAADNEYSFQLQSSQGTIRTQDPGGARLTWIEHDADTGSSSSGSPLINRDSGQIIGIHTHGDSERLVNSGTSLFQTPRLKTAIESCLTSDKEQSDR